VNSRADFAVNAKSFSISIGFMVLLGACELFDDREPAVAAAPARAATGTINAESALPDDTGIPQVRVLVVPARKPKLVEGLPVIDPNQLVGLDRDGVLDLLGRPALEEEAAPAKVWVYNAESCVLQIFFYPEIVSKEFQVLTYEIRNVEADENARRACLKEVLQANAAG
jgi:hypothetical protein